MLDFQLNEFEERSQGEIPSRIMALPEDDPERKRFLRGWEARQRRAMDASDYLLTAKSRAKGLGFRLNLPLLATLLFMATVFMGMYVMIENYVETVYELRTEIRLTMVRKGYVYLDPEMRRMVDQSRRTAFIPSLYASLAEAQSLPVKRNGEESESYLAYIKRTGRLFDTIEGLEWLTDSYR